MTDAIGLRFYMIVMLLFIFLQEKAKSETVNHCNYELLNNLKNKSDKHATLEWFLNSPPNSNRYKNIPERLKFLAVAKVKIIQPLVFRTKRVGGMDFMGANVRVLEQIHGEIGLGEIYVSALCGASGLHWIAPNKDEYSLDQYVVILKSNENKLYLNYFVSYIE